MLQSIYPNTTYEVLDTVAAAAADTDVTEGVFTLGDFSCNYLDIQTNGAIITPSVAEVLQVTTATPVNAANSTYAMTITQYNPNTGQYFEGYYSHTTAAAGSSAITISDALKAQIRAQAAVGTIQLTVAADGAGDIVITAVAGYPTFIVQINETGGGFSAVTGTPGVMAVNTLAALALQGITVTQAAYTSVMIKYNPITGYDLKDPVRLHSVHTEYINEGDGDAQDLIDAVTYLLSGRSVSIGGVANPEAISKV